MHLSEFLFFILILFLFFTFNSNITVESTQVNRALIRLGVVFLL